MTEIPHSLRGYVLAYVTESIDSRDICLYGDPEGLRSLGEALIAIANLDQKTDKELPSDDSFHQHYNNGVGIDEAIHRSLPRITIGRVDEKSSGLVRDVFPDRAS